MKKIVFILCILFSSCVTRTKIPLLEGYVYDSEKSPLSDVNVCVNTTTCVKTDTYGYFLIKRENYKEIAIVGGEAPAVIYNLSFSKNKYSDTLIYYKNLHGGASADLKVNYDTIILKKKR